MKKIPRKREERTMEIRETAARLWSKNLRDGCAALDAGEDNPNA